MTAAAASLRDQVRAAVIWRSGTQILGQLITWVSTFLVIRILSPADYGLLAMTAVVLYLFSLMNGFGLANALIREREAGPERLRQLFGMLIVLNAGLALLQVAAAPWVAAYYGQPIVADMLRVQALLYVTNPFLALGYAVLSRAMDFRRQAQVNVVSALLGAAAALAGALAGLGVWTLVLAPLVQFGSRALGMTLAARCFVVPSFAFRGAGGLARYGGIAAIAQVFWFVQNQADVILAGRAFTPHALGLYTTSLFLTQIFVNKFVPPLNEVAFSAYARVQDDEGTFRTGFLTSVRVIMLLALPISFGMAATAQPLVATVLGPKWLEAAPVVALLALAMPLMTLHVLFAPATNARGAPGIATRTAMLGAALFPLAFAAGLQWGPVGLAAAWVLAYPAFVLLSAHWSLPVIGVSARALADALAPPALAAAAMVLAVRLLDAALPELPPAARLALLATAGAAMFVAAMALYARERLTELLALLTRR